MRKFRGVTGFAHARHLRFKGIVGAAALAG